jgi:hypothetical protein
MIVNAQRQAREAHLWTLLCAVDQLDSLVPSPIWCSHLHMYAHFLYDNNHGRVVQGPRQAHVVTACDDGSMSDRNMKFTRVECSCDELTATSPCSCTQYSWQSVLLVYCDTLHVLQTCAKRQGFCLFVQVSAYAHTCKRFHKRGHCTRHKSVIHAGAGMASASERRNHFASEGAIRFNGRLHKRRQADEVDITSIRCFLCCISVCAGLCKI